MALETIKYILCALMFILCVPAHAQLSDVGSLDTFLNDVGEQRGNDEPVFQKERGEVYDSITEKLYTDPFTALRFSTISLSDNPKYPLVQFEMVKVLLVYGKFVEALEEANRIASFTWRARAFLIIGDYERLNGRKDNALSFYRQILEFYDKDTKQEDGGKTLEIVASRFAQNEQYELMTRAFNLISNPLKRFSTMEELLQFLVDTKDPKYRVIIAAVAKASYDLSKNFDPNQFPEVFNHLNRVALSAAKVGIKQIANVIYDDILSKLILRDDFESQRAYAEALAGKIIIGETRNVMRQVQELSLPSQRAIAWATIAHIRSLKGDIDATVPLFTLALEEADNVRTQALRNLVWHHIALQQAETNRANDALKTITKIDNINQRIDSLMEIAQLLLNQNLLKEALEMLNYIPFVGMRANIMVAVAAQLSKDQKNFKQVDNLLLNALNDTKAKPRPDYLRTAVIRVLNAQVKFGSPDNDSKIFNRVREMVDQINEPLLKVQLLSNIARIQVNRKYYEEAKLTLNRAVIANYELKKPEEIGQALREIVGLKLYFGEFVDAFDNAARIPKTNFDDNLETDEYGRLKSPRFITLAEVARFLAEGEDRLFVFVNPITKKEAKLDYNERVDLAMRATRQIDNPISQAIMVGEVAIAVKRYFFAQEVKKKPSFKPPNTSYADTHRDDVINLKIDFNNIIVQNKRKNS